MDSLKNERRYHETVLIEKGDKCTVHGKCMTSAFVRSVASCVEAVPTFQRTLQWPSSE
jgi:hypothetical protein